MLCLLSRSDTDVHGNIANSLLDSLARQRHALNLPAISLILPAILGIGHIAENDTANSKNSLEKAIQMKGMYGIREKEMLEAFEVAMHPQSSLPLGTDHIIVGLQPRRFGPAVRAAGASERVLSDENPALNWMAVEVGEQGGGGGQEDGAGKPGAQSAQDAINMIRQGGGCSELVVEAVTGLLGRRLGRLLMIDQEAIQPTGKSLAAHGLDSMIGAEFRNWIFREFKINVPFQQLLAGSLSIEQLAKMVCEKVSDGQES